MTEISSRFTGPAMLRTVDRFEVVLPEPTEVEERLQAALLADKLPTKRVAAKPLWRRLMPT